MDSKELKKWAWHHTLWHFTGAPLLDWIFESWKLKAAIVLSSVGIGFLSHLTGVRWEWATVIGLETLAVALFVWDRAAQAEDRKKSNEQKPPSLSPLDEAAVNRADAEFKAMTWGQKVCLSLLYQKGPMHFAELDKELKGTRIC